MNPSGSEELAALTSRDIPTEGPVMVDKEMTNEPFNQITLTFDETNESELRAHKDISEANKETIELIEEVTFDDTAAEESDKEIYEEEGEGNQAQEGTKVSTSSKIPKSGLVVVDKQTVTELYKKISAALDDTKSESGADKLSSGADADKRYQAQGESDASSTSKSISSSGLNNKLCHQMLHFDHIKSEPVEEKDSSVTNADKKYPGQEESDGSTSSKIKMPIDFNKLRERIVGLYNQVKEALDGTDDVEWWMDDEEAVAAWQGDYEKC